MRSTIVESSIQTDEQKDILTDEVPRGLKGDKGDAGPKGRDGRNGIDGDIGNNGTNGHDGRDGRDGTNGKDGAQGLTGKDGKHGKKGTDGLNGTNGDDGDDGKDGADGPEWFIFEYIIDDKKGVNGDMALIQKTSHYYRKEKGLWKFKGSIQGNQGEKGERGVTGSDGGRGSIGATGPQGIAGQTGATGPQGIQGSTGSQGPTGATGAQGPGGFPYKFVQLVNSTVFANKFFDLPRVAIASSIEVRASGSPLQDEGVDYSVSLTGGASGKTRITLIGDLLSLVELNENMYVSYDSTEV